MRRLAILAVLTIGAAPALAQMPSSSQPQAPPAEAECIAAGILSFVGIGRELTGPHDSGRLSVNVTLQNRTQRSAAFVLNFTAPNVTMPAVNQWRTLEAQARGTYLVGTLPRGTLITDNELRTHVQLRCVR
ncbi:MAG: hypothetical protein JWR00_3907 [Rubritepida sp.]|nr:hypothetical protein [Rubritepida sp.]